MSYQVYTTPAIIISSSITNEANKTIEVFARDFGRITVTIQNGAAVSSKLRMGLQTLSNPTVSLIKGRYKWRCLGIEPGNLPICLATAQSKVAWQQILKVVDQLVPYQSAEPLIYDLLIKHGSHLLKAEDKNVTFPLMNALADILGVWGYFDREQWIKRLPDRPTNQEIVEFTKAVHEALYKSGVTNLQVVYQS